MALEYIDIVSGPSQVPLYLLQFDKRGTPTSPATRAELIEAVRAGRYSDVYIFAHGWNNDFDASETLFKTFFQGFLGARPADPAWQPVFVGIQWPSIAIVFPWEKGPQLAGGTPDNEFQRRAAAQIAAELPPIQALRFTQLLGQPALSNSNQTELAALVCAAIRADGLSDAGETSPDEQELLSAWRSLQNSSAAEDNSGDFGFADEPGAAPRAAGLGFLDPRNLVRGATVYMMKDRAGVIGSVGVKPLIEALASTGAQIRLIGHSFGARVMLAALSTATLQHKVRSALLLQPAVNQFCLADAGQIPGSAQAGGFRKALDQLALPLYTTFSAKDFPLHDTFHLALRRAKDLGEAAIAAGAPPSIYCALGGYGPCGIANGAAASAQIQDSGSYELSAGSRVLALDGTAGRINGHGDVTNRYTWWALAEQDRRAIRTGA